MKRYYLILSALCLSVTAIFAQTTVTVQSNTFTPQNLTINVGETVIFDNIGGFHNVNGTQTTFPMNPESFGNGGAASAPWNYEHTFTVPGVYNYQCDPHAGLGMDGTITVESTGATGEIVLTEIMYNPPESGNDSLEYLEFFNNGDEGVNLEGWTLDGVEFTFPAVTLEAGEYVVVAKNSAAMESVLGVTGTLQWTGGALTNGGETIQLINNMGAVVDEVPYDDGGDWVTTPDGDGPSLVLCDPSSDNSDAANWIAATTSLDAEADGTTYFGNPGADSGCPDGPILTWLDTETTVSEGVGTVTGRVAIAFGNENETSVTAILSTLTTADFETDFNYETVVLTFPAGTAQDTMEVTVEITDDEIGEDTEIVALAIIQPTNDAVISQSGLSFIITVEDDDTVVDYEEYTIGEVTVTDENGVGTFVDSLVQIQGVVYGVNMRPAGLQFTIIDENNDGIGLFFNEGDLGYTVNEGDEVVVQGEISQFNGLLQINPVSVDLIDQGNMLFDPTVVTELNEETESQLVTLQDVTLVDPNDWTNAGSGFNVDVTDGTNTYTVRIDADIDLYGMAAPTGTFNVTGLGGQFDNSSPFDGGYQLLPRYTEDIDPYDTGSGPGDPFYTDHDIIDITGLNDQGEADSLNAPVRVTGIVHGIDYRGGDGVQFFLNDGTDGIGIFSFDYASYEVTEGDEITVEGTVGQFAGLTQITVDTIMMQSADNDLFGPTLEQTVNENTESELIELRGTFVDVLQWMPEGSGFNMDFETESGTMIIVRIDNDSQLFLEESYPLQVNTVSVIGMGSQFDNSAPFDEGYQILPRYLEDISVILKTNDPSLAAQIDLFPNPAQDLVSLNVRDVKLEKVVISNLLGQTVSTFAGNANELNISNLAQGVYTVTFYTEDNRMYSEQLMKK